MGEHTMMVMAVPDNIVFMQNDEGRLAGVHPNSYPFVAMPNLITVQNIEIDSSLMECDNENERCCDGY